MRAGILMALLGVAIGCGGEGTEGGGQGGGGAGGSGGAGGALVEPVTCDSMCHHIYWGCGRVLLVGGERLVGKPQCVTACESGRMGDAEVQCLGTAPCTDEGIRACFEWPEPTCDNVCYLGNYCYIMDAGLCLDSCRGGQMSEAQRECLLAAGIQCNARNWEACLD